MISRHKGENDIYHVSIPHRWYLCARDGLKTCATCGGWWEPSYPEPPDNCSLGIYRGERIEELPKEKLLELIAHLLQMGPK